MFQGCNLKDIELHLMKYHYVALGHLNNHTLNTRINVNKRFEIHLPVKNPELFQRISKFLEDQIPEPVSLFTCRYFIEDNSSVCFLVYDTTPVIDSELVHITEDIHPTPLHNTCHIHPVPLFNDTHQSICLLQETPKIQNLAHDGQLIAVVLNKIDVVCAPDTGDIPQWLSHYKHSDGYSSRGYIGVIAVTADFRRQGLGKLLMELTIRTMTRFKVDEIILETEVTNRPALKLYQDFGFYIATRMTRYYMSTGNDAYLLKKPLHHIQS